MTHDFRTLFEAKLEALYAKGRDDLASGVCLHHPRPELDYASRAGFLRAIIAIRDTINLTAEEINDG